MSTAIPNDKGLREGGLCLWWWRRGESNPRPQAFFRQFYMRSQAIWFNRCPADRRAGQR